MMFKMFTAGVLAMVGSMVVVNAEQGFIIHPNMTKLSDIDPEGAARIYELLEEDPEYFTKRNRRQTDYEKKCDIAISVNNELNVQKWIPGNYLIAKDLHGDIDLWPPGHLAESRPYYKSEEHIFTDDNELAYPFVYYLSLNENFKVWAISVSKCARDHTREENPGPCAVNGYWVNSVDASVGPALEDGSFRYYNYPIGRWTDPGGSVECACPEGQYIKDESSGCVAYSDCPPGQYITQTGSLLRDRKCAACPDGKFSTTKNVEECKEQTVCDPGEFVTRSASKSVDRECGDCDDGKYSKTNNAEKCVPHQDCPPGTEVVLPDTASLIEDRTCNICESGKTFSDDSGGTRVCFDCKTQCGDEQYIAQPCSALSDMVCADCPKCSSNQYQVGECDKTKTIAPECKQCHSSCASCAGPSKTECYKCPDGILLHSPKTDEELTQDGQHTGVCVKACDEGLWEDRDPSHLQNDQEYVCKPCHESCSDCSAGGSNDCLHCPVGQSLVLVGDDNTGRCVNTGECPSGYYSGYAEGSAVLTCLQCKTCDMASGFYTKYECQANHDTVCEAYTAECDGSTFYESKAPTSSSDRECSPCLTCPAGTKTVSTAKGAAQTCARDPSDCVTCILGVEYQDQPGQIECVPQIQCGAGEEELVLASITSKRVCSPCAEGFFDDDSNPATRCDRKTECNPHDVQILAEYEVTPGTSTTNRECASVTYCLESMEFETAEPTPTSDRTCEEFLECDFYDPATGRGTEYESVPGNPNANRKCKKLTECKGANKYEVVTPTRVSDRICSKFEDRFNNGDRLSNHQFDVDQSNGHVACIYLAFLQPMEAGSTVQDYIESGDGSKQNVTEDACLKDEFCSELEVYLLQAGGTQVVTHVCKEKPTEDPTPIVQGSSSDDDSASSQSLLIVIVIAAIIVAIVIVVAAVLVSKSRNSSTQNARQVVSFGNPMYDSTPAAVNEGDYGEAQAYEPESSGYMDVNPADDGDDV